MLAPDSLETLIISMTLLFQSNLARWNKCALVASAIYWVRFIFQYPHQTDLIFNSDAKSNWRQLRESKLKISTRALCAACVCDNVIGEALVASGART